MTIRCLMCNDWAYLRLGHDDWIECPNGETGWSSNHPDFNAVPVWTSTAVGVDDG